MRNTSYLLVLVALFVTLVPSLTRASESLPERAEGKANAPITVIEYSSFTCSHCATFYNDIMPELEKRYIETGKVRFIYRDFPMDGVGLKASAIAHCMPENQFFPFLRILFKNQMTWARSSNPEATLTQYAQMAGLTTEKIKSCLQSDKMLDALVAQRTEATDKLGIQATPTFVINNGAAKLVGAQSIDEFAAAFDKILAAKK